MHDSFVVRSERAGAVRPRNARDIIALLNAGVITLAEARQYLGLAEECDLCA